LKAGELLLFLNPVSTYGLTSPVGLDQGRFRVVSDDKGNRYALNGRGNLGLFAQVTAKTAPHGITFSKQAMAMLANQLVRPRSPHWKKPSKPLFR